MDDFLQADFLVTSAALRAIHQKLSTDQHIEAKELSEITEGLVVLVNTLIQFVENVDEDPGKQQKFLSVFEPFEEVVVLIWRISWLESQRGLDDDHIRKLCNQLQKLHLKLDDLHQGEI
jgi:hypothetical protein